MKASIAIDMNAACALTATWQLSSSLCLVNNIGKTDMNLGNHEALRSPNFANGFKL